MPLPRDGLTGIDRTHTNTRRRWWIWRLAPACAALAAVLVLAIANPQRQQLLAILGVGSLAPALILPLRRGWASPLLLVVVAAALSWQAAVLRVRLPPGNWSTPWSSARCSSQVTPVGDQTAWCVAKEAQAVRRFSLSSGAVLEHYPVDDVRQVLLGDDKGAWVAPQTGRGLVYVGAVVAYVLSRVRSFFHSDGAYTSENELWIVDGMQKLLSYSGVDEPVQLTTVNSGLRTDYVNTVESMPDGSVWVGYGSGISRYTHETDRWSAYTFQQAGFQGAVTDIAAGTDGRVWALQREGFNKSNRIDWWLSGLGHDDRWLHVNLADVTGLQPSPMRAALAVDGIGRPWFLAMNFDRGENYLGVLKADGELAFPMLLLGSMQDFVRYHPGAIHPTTIGVVPDGAGGIYLYKARTSLYATGNPESV